MIESVIIVYLIIGFAAATLMYLAVAAGLRHAGKNSELDQEMRGLEMDVSQIPGGMPAALLIVAVSWPYLIASFILSRFRPD